MKNFEILVLLIIISAGAGGLAGAQESHPKPYLVVATREEQWRPLEPTINITTTLYRVDVQDRTLKPIFSDEKAEYCLQVRYGSATSPTGAVVARGNRVLALAMRRPVTRHDGPETLVDVSTDGSNRLVKIADIQDSRPVVAIALSDRAAKVAYFIYMTNARGDRVHGLVVHDSRTGAVLGKTPLPFMADCIPYDLIWDNDGQHLFVRFETGDEHITSDEAYKQAGKYRFKMDGSDIQRIDDFPIGVLPDDFKLFGRSKVVEKNGKGEENWEVAIKNNKGEEKRRLSLGNTGSWWYISSEDGKWLAFHPQYTTSQAHDPIRVLNLETGEIWDAPIPTVQNQTTIHSVGLVGWLEGK